MEKAAGGEIPCDVHLRDRLIPAGFSDTDRSRGWVEKVYNIISRWGTCGRRMVEAGGLVTNPR